MSMNRRSPKFFGHSVSGGISGEVNRVHDRVAELVAKAIEQAVADERNATISLLQSMGYGCSASEFADGMVKALEAGEHRSDDEELPELEDA